MFTKSIATSDVTVTSQSNDIVKIRVAPTETNKKYVLNEPIFEVWKSNVNGKSQLTSVVNTFSFSSNGSDGTVWYK